jgi:hypothetical protein
VSREKEENEWLVDSEVKYQITPVKGRWEVSLIFINTKDPKEFLVRTIGDYRSERLAEIAGRHMQQTAAKDPRGTQKVDEDAYDINKN